MPKTDDLPDRMSDVALDVNAARLAVMIASRHLPDFPNVCKTLDNFISQAEAALTASEERVEELERERIELAKRVCEQRHAAMTEWRWLQAALTEWQKETE